MAMHHRLRGIPNYWFIIIIIIISGFGIYGAAVVPDSGVGNTWFVAYKRKSRST